jgi:hypothetical protein
MQCLQQQQQIINITPSPKNIGMPSILFPHVYGFCAASFIQEQQQILNNISYPTTHESQQSFCRVSVFLCCRSTEALEAMQCLQQQQLILSNPEYQTDAASLGDVIRGTARGVATPWDMLRR